MHVLRSVGLVALVLLAARSADAAGGVRERLASTDTNEAWQATVEAATSKDVTLAGPLLDAGWQTAYPHIAVGCGDAMAALGPEAAKDAELQKALAKALKGKDPRGQMNLARVLGAWGDPTVDELLASLASGRRPPEVQSEALHMIGSLRVRAETPFPRCVDAVRTALKDADPLVLCAACSAASRVGDSSFLEPLVDVVRRATDRRAGLYAVFALRRLGKPVDIGPLVHVVQAGSAKRETLNACLRAVTDLSKPEDVETLLSLSRATKPDVRDAACIALGAVGGPGADRVQGGRVVTGDASPPPPSPVPPDVLSKVVERLLQVVEADTSWEVRDGAQRSLLRIGDLARPQAAAKLPGLVEATDRDVSLTATDLCGVFRANDAVKALAKTAQFDDDPVRRMYAARALGEIAPQATAEEFLAAVAKDKKGKAQTLNLVRALGYVRHDAAFRGLVAMVGSSEWSEPMLREAERSLERLTRRRFGRDPARWDLWYARAKGHDPFVFHVPSYDRSKQRSDALGKNRKKFGITETTERAVEAGLRWLEQQQHGEGFWDGNEKGFNGFVGCEPAYTGLSLLAYLGAGYGPQAGRYRETIRRGAEFLAAAQYYDGGFPVAGTGDQTAFFAYVIGMANWAINEAYTISGDAFLKEYAQRGIDYMVRTQTLGGGWRYGPRYLESDASCTSWVYMGLKAGLSGGLRVPQKSLDGIDMWLEKAQTDVTGEVERPEDMTTDFDREVGVKRTVKAITGYLPITAGQQGTYHQDSMTPVGMVCRFFMGWRRSHPFLIGSANYTAENPPQWMKGTGISEYYYYWYYGTLAMYQMGGRYWRAWNEKIKTMLPDRQRVDPPALAGSWDPDTSRGGGGRLFSTPAAILTLETYYRFSPMLDESDEDLATKMKELKQGGGPAMGEPAGMDDTGMGG